MAQRNLVVRVGIDASGYTQGLQRIKKETKSVSEQMARETKTVGEQMANGAAGQSISQQIRASQKVAAAQPGTTLSDRVGSMLNGGIPLITEVDINNISEARRQAEDLGAALTKLQAKGTDAANATGADAEKYWQIKGMYEAIVGDIYNYDEALREQYKAEMDAEVAASGHAKKLGSVSSAVGKLSSRLGRLVSHPFQTLRTGASFIQRLGTSSKSSALSVNGLLRNIQRIGVVSLSIRIAGAAFGRLKSIVSEYISSNATLQAQVNGLKTSLGQALAPAIGMVVNLFSQLMPYVLGVANALGSLMGSLFGSAWNQTAAGASKTAAATGSAAKAQKELNNQLLGFDTITRLEDNDASDASGGGGGSSVGAANIQAKTPAWMERLKGSFSDLFNSGEFKAANIGGKLGMAIQTGLDWIGTEAGNFDWSGAGRKLRENWDSFWTSGVAGSFGEALVSVLAGAISFVISFIDPSFVELKQAWETQGLKGVAAYVNGITKSGKTSLTSTFFTGIVSPMYQGLANSFRQSGHQSIAGFFQGLADKASSIGEYLKTHFVDLVVNSIASLLGIGGPHPLFTTLAQQCADDFVQPLRQIPEKITKALSGAVDSVKDVAGKIKNAFTFNWQLPTMQLPHLQVDWVEAGGLLSKFLGVSHIPNLSVKWFAQGGILDGAQLFGRMGGTLLGGGEAGREAVLPLDRNTGWMDKIADRVVSKLGTGGDVNATIQLVLDGKVITETVVRRLRQQARASGQPVWG